MRTISTCSRRTLLALLILGGAGACVLAPRPALAAESDAARQKRAREAYEIGLRHYKVGDWAQAVEKFKEAYLIRPDPSFLFNIGQAYRQLGDAAAAIRAYRNYLKDRPDAPNRRDVEGFIRDLEAGPAKSPAPNSTPPPPPAAAAAEAPPAAVEPAANPTPANPPLAPGTYPGAWPPPPAVREIRPDSRFGFEVSAGFSYRFLYETSFVGAEAAARLGTRTERAKLFFNLRVFGGQGLPGITTVAIAPGFLGQGRIGRVYLGGGVHASLLFLSGPIGTKLLWDQTIGASVDVDVAVARWGRRELLVGATGAVDLLLGSLLGNNIIGRPVMVTAIARVGFGF